MSAGGVLVLLVALLLLSLSALCSARPSGSSAPSRSGGPPELPPESTETEHADGQKWTDSVSTGFGSHISEEKNPETETVLSAHGEYQSSSSSSSSSYSNSSSSSSTTFGLLSQLSQTHNSTGSSSKNSENEHLTFTANQNGKQDKKPSATHDAHHASWHHTTIKPLRKPQPPSLPPKPLHPITIHWEPHRKPNFVSNKEGITPTHTNIPTASNIELEPFGVALVPTDQTTMPTSSEDGHHYGDTHGTVLVVSSTDHNSGSSDIVSSVATASTSSHEEPNHSEIVVGSVIPVVPFIESHHKRPISHNHGLSHESIATLIPEGGNEVFVLNLSGPQFGEGVDYSKRKREITRQTSNSYLNNVHKLDGHSNRFVTVADNADDKISVFGVNVPDEVVRIFGSAVLKHETTPSGHFSSHPPDLIRHDCGLYHPGYDSGFLINPYAVSFSGWTPVTGVTTDNGSGSYVGSVTSGISIATPSSSVANSMVTSQSGSSSATDIASSVFNALSSSNSASSASSAQHTGGSSQHAGSEATGASYNYGGSSASSGSSNQANSHESTSGSTSSALASSLNSQSGSSGNHASSSGWSSSSNYGMGGASNSASSNSASSASSAQHTGGSSQYAGSEATESSHSNAGSSSHSSASQSGASSLANNQLASTSASATAASGSVASSYPSSSSSTGEAGATSSQSVMLPSALCAICDQFESDLSASGPGTELARNYLRRWCQQHTSFHRFENIQSV